MVFIIISGFTGRRRASYTSLTRNKQVLNHQNDDTEIEIENVSEVKSTIGSTNTNICTKEYTPKAPSPVEYTIYGYKNSTLRTYLYHIICIALFGIPYLISRLSLQFYVWFKLKTCDLDDCDCVLSEFFVV